MTMTHVLFRNATLLLSLFALSSLLTQAYGQDQLKKDPGYLDMRMLETWFESTPTMEVHVGEALLKVVAEASRSKDPELAARLLKLRAIQIKGFSVNRKSLHYVEQHLAGIATHLEADGWDNLLSIRSEDKRIDMYLVVEDDSVAGLVAMTLKPGADQVVFLNVIGEVNPNHLSESIRPFFVL